MKTARGNRRKWIAAYEKERDYFATPPEPFKDWSRRTMPEATAALFLQDAAEALYGYACRDVADRFLHAAVDMIDRAILDEKMAG